MNPKNRRKLKIFYLITKGDVGGATRYVYDLATNLPKENYDVTVIFGQPGLLQTKLTSAGIKTIPIPYLQRDISVSKEIKTFLFLLNLFKTEKPDIIHLNSSKIGGLGALAGRLAGTKKIIFTGHGWAFNEMRPGWQKKIILFLHWLTIILNHQTITVAESLKKQLVFLPGVKNKMTTIHNGISPFNLKSKDDAKKYLAQKISTTLDDHLILGSISELHLNKGLDIAIKAIARVIKNYPTLKYIIIGGGEEKDNLTNLIKNLGLEKNIFLTGQIDDAKTLLSAFDIFLLPSRTEAFPYVILEAMFANLPIIASDVGGIKEILIPDNLHQLIAPNNSKILAETVINTTTHLKDLKISTDNLVKNSLSNMVSQTIELYA